MTSMRDSKTDLRWKRTYLCELEKKLLRQQAAVADTQAELTTLESELSELEREIDGQQGTQPDPHGDQR